MRENRDKTHKQIAQLWGDETTQQNISYGKKLGITSRGDNPAHLPRLWRIYPT